MINDGLFSSDKKDWGTPPDLFNALNEEFEFTVDVAANHENALVPWHYYTKETDGLAQDWSGEAVYMNPPYGREIGKWVRKAYEDTREKGYAVCLLPARTDTAWWHDYVMKAVEIRLIRGRLRFVGAENSAPFPSAIVIFGQAAYMDNPNTVSCDKLGVVRGR